MSNESSGGTAGSGGFLGLLFIVFLVLKLTGVVDWSWWWITAPLWGPVALVLTLAVLFAVGAALMRDS